MNMVTNILSSIFFFRKKDEFNDIRPLIYFTNLILVLAFSILIFSLSITKHFYFIIIIVAISFIYSSLASNFILLLVKMTVNGENKYKIKNGINVPTPYKKHKEITITPEDNTEEESEISVAKRKFFDTLDKDKVMDQTLILVKDTKEAQINRDTKKEEKATPVKTSKKAISKTKNSPAKPTTKKKKSGTKKTSNVKKTGTKKRMKRTNLKKN